MVLHLVKSSILIWGKTHVFKYFIASDTNKETTSYFEYFSFIERLGITKFSVFEKKPAKKLTGKPSKLIQT